AGIAVFFLMSLLSLSPVVWFGLAGAAALVVLHPRDLPLSIPLLVGAVVVVYLAGVGSYWSPYYRLTVLPNEDGGYVINVNNTQHQATTPYMKKETFYFRTYDLFPGQAVKRVMILGAGTGSDVQIALANGAEQVDAVEIDPWIYRLGLSLHPDHPYADPRVKVHIEDGRTFLRNTTEEYDLIIYALPDSLTLTSAYSSLRLESFLLTSNSIAEAYRHLSPNGLVVLYNYYRENWLIEKLAGMVQSATGTAPYVTTYGDTGRAAVFMAGPRLKTLPAAVNMITGRIS
ncbi:MAG: spermidine synthase, partial [Anaerolineaceae bacterium]|nr:spermidine synthase [Anaerolineaceae bacterium]